MTVTGPDLFKRIGSIEERLRGCLADCTTLRAHLAALDLPDDKELPFVCVYDHCGYRFATDQRRTEHLENVHGIRPVGEGLPDLPPRVSRTLADAAHPPEPAT